MKMNILTLNVYINAWLDCSNPFISIHNRYDDDLVAHFSSERISQLIEDGDIYIEDLQSTDHDIQMEIVMTLMTIKSSDYIKQQMNDLSRSVNKRMPAPIRERSKIESKKGLQISDWFLSPALKAV